MDEPPPVVKFRVRRVDGMWVSMRLIEGIDHFLHAPQVTPWRDTADAVCVVSYMKTQHPGCIVQVDLS